MRVDLNSSMDPTKPPGAGRLAVEGYGWAWDQMLALAADLITA